MLDFSELSNNNNPGAGSSTKNDSDLPEGLDLTGVDPSVSPDLIALIKENQQAFSQGPFDLGMCNIIPHEIHVKDDIPVSLPHRRVAPHMVQEVKDHLQNLLDQGVIRRSFSSYGSPDRACQEER